MDKETEKLTGEQFDLAKSIQKSLSNLKKEAGRVRKQSSEAKADYIKKKRAELAASWTAFTQRHSAICATHSQEHDYFARNFYTQTHELVLEYEQFLNEIEMPIPSSPRPPAETYVPGTEFFPKTGQTSKVPILLRKQQFKLARLSKEISDISMQLEQEHPTTYWEYKKEKIHQQWASVQQFQEDILVSDDITDMGMEAFEQTEEAVQNVMLKLCAKLSKPTHADIDNKISLPKVKIPVFDGDYQSWTSFHDLYSRLIHNNKNIGNVEKMQFLLTSIKGEAFKLLQHLTIAERNYEIAWELLTNRYNNKRILVASQIENIFNLPKMFTASSQDLKRIHDTLAESVRSIGTLGIPTTDWGPLLLHILLSKIDEETRCLFEQSLEHPKEFPAFTDAMSFIETRFQSLEFLKRISNKKSENNFKKIGREAPIARSYHTKSSNCLFCKEQHIIYTCKKFADLTVQDRFNFVKKEKLCRNCMNHDIGTKCPSTRKCSKCEKPHHTLLHFEKKPGTPQPAAVNVAIKDDFPNIVITGTEVLLATAMVRVKNAEQGWNDVRVLIDQGSQLSFITKDTAQTLGLPKKKANVEVSGVGGSHGGLVRAKISAELFPRMSSNFKMLCELLIIPRVTSSNIPTSEPNGEEIRRCMQNTYLADPTFDIPGPVDILLGADAIPYILKRGVKIPRKGCVAQNTELGWIISGRPQPLTVNSPVTTTSMISVINDNELSKFWEIEEVSGSISPSEEDKVCEAIYEQTTVRNEDGRYTVSLPFKDRTDTLGNTRKLALARLLQMEKKFRQHPSFEEQYKSFMQEYEKLGHMVLVEPGQELETKYYIPHHAVLKEDSTTTRLRVVFDASARSSAGKCLNELMYVGPRLQDDLAQILLRWRKHAVVLAADIEKMYRQIRVNYDDQAFQTILWRYSTNEPVKEYRLSTVTYGTSSAPYLAVKTLQQLASDEQDKFPVAAQVAKSDFYVDDMLSGCDNINSARSLQEDIMKMLQTGGFNLRKWKSNCPELLASLPIELRDSSYLEVGGSETTKMLGVHWAPATDRFKYRVSISQIDKPTKRSILSQIAKLYDPVGWLAPFIIKAKLLMQDMWLNDASWDEEVQPPIRNHWLEFQSDLHLLEDINIPRWLHYKDGASVELHGFCDASERAYGAVVYSRIMDDSGKTHVTILAAKSKVAPIKIRKTLPRLELCGAVVLAKLLTHVRESLKFNHVPTFAWSDSMIALAWIKGKPERWHTFIGNRVSEILQHTRPCQWRHVVSEENPADLVSRGVTAVTLKNSSLWWSGPSWLKENHPPSASVTEFYTTEESKTKVQTFISRTRGVIFTESFSSFSRMVRVIAYCIKFCNKSRGRIVSETLTTGQLQEALEMIVRMVQATHFPNELTRLETNQQVNRTSKLLPLNPFLDDKGIIRVGGRLENTTLSFGEKHPIIIPHEDPLAELIINDSHLRTLHGGLQLTLALVRRKYWITRAGSKVRHCINKCVKCARFKQQSPQQLMGNLPKCRVEMNPPFSSSGVDYAGPIQIRVSKGRGNKSYKGYVAIFVCMSTKAVHLEAVSDMTTDAFLAAFKRFVSRKGHCAHLYSDNGTNFIGANKILDKELRMAMQNPKFPHLLTSHGTNWHFIPPAAPHFGGLWEAGVKSMKHHLKRIISDHTLTFEELSTVLCQIEACLNSRPLCAIQNSNDVTLLTPGHLLIGRALITQPDEVDLNENPKIITRWHLLKKMKKDFWKIWSTDYLNQLQQRYKWKTPEDNVKVGDIVLVKDENYPPTKWPMAKVIETHIGTDGRTRVVSVKTQGGTLKRPIVKLCRLPVENELDTETTTSTLSNLSKMENTTQFSQQSRSTPMTYLIMLFLAINIGVSTCDAASYSIKYPPPGLYVEHLGEAFLNRGLLRIDAKLNKSTLLEHNALINQTIHQLQHVCSVSKSLSDEIKCDNLIHELETRQYDLQLHLNVVLNGYSIRTRRGILGQFLTTVFGVNDEVYTDIAELNENQKQLIRSSKQQAAIMVKTVTTLNETEQRITDKLNHFTQKLNQGLREIHAFESWYRAVDVNKINIHILYLHQLVHSLMVEIEDKYESLLRVMHHGGHMIDFLTPKEFHKIISNVTNQLSSQFKIITHHVVRMELEHSEEQLIIHCYFHITEKPKFDLINVTPIPLWMGNDTFAALSSEESLLAIDYNNQHYFELSRTELREAIHLSENKYLLMTDVIHDMNTSPNCIVDLIYSRIDQKRCKHQLFKIPQLLFKHLYMQNTWMFITNKAVRISLYCDEHREDIWLNGTGVIQIDQHCILNTNKNVLKTRISKQVQQVVAFHKPLPIDRTSIHFLPEMKMDAEPILKAHDSFSNILQDQLLLQTNLTETTWDKIKPHVTSSGTSMVTVLTVGLVGGALWYVYKRCIRSKPKQPSFVLARQDVQEGTV